MDDYLFETHVWNCKNVVEATSYLEILNYSVRLTKEPNCGPPQFVEALPYSEMLTSEPRCRIRCITL